jgi:hypothetical protein
MTTVMAKPPAKVSPENLRKSACDCAVLIVAAGFEMRARRVLEILDATLLRRVILIRYEPALKENEENFDRMMSRLARMDAVVEVVPIDPRRPDEFLHGLRMVLLRWRPDAFGEVWLDISALPMQGICASLGAVREVLPSLEVRVMYTEAAKYFPTKAEASAAEGMPLSAMSQEMSTNLIPKHFGGSSTAVSTCLIVFAGYEKHRSFGVVDELNPSKLVLIFGRPGNEQLAWRLPWSEKLHEELVGRCPTATEVVSTLDPLQSITLLNSYYSFLFADHNIAVAPICSKMQCVASYLFWERYRDVQLVFPLPVTYLPRRFSERSKDTFTFLLPTVAEMSELTASPL